ncbi:GAF and ANTAR domain-containing protein [Streptomyces sp. NP160]|uniref:GAF and ANTAR domain-containing protein n=1 Tax=Streptomyces sp. NP160 TaxID=2586637 RepID=UPI00111AB874|nr:GAF and ANTAR domain-containing protein [Streptomyces sp. NP160]TNM67155.1 GAF and ANTAR domain-containing protein [Streptomyces sp. NP160]
MSPSTAPELRVCEALREAVGWDRVAVVVATGPDDRLPLRGSDAVLEHFCDLQQSLAQGPSVDVLSSGVPVLVDDLRTAVAPWPLLLSAVPRDVPLRSLAVLPLRLSTGRATSAPDHGGSTGPSGPGVVGVLAVGRDQPRPFTHRQVDDLTALAALVTAVVLQRASTEELFTEDAARDEHLPIVVGMLRARLGAGPAEALARLRAYAFSCDTTIQVVARHVLSGDVDLADVARS